MLRDKQNFWRRLNLSSDLFLTLVALLGMLYIYSPEINPYASGLLIALTLLVWGLFLFGPTGAYFYRMKSLGRILKELYWALGKSFLTFTAAIYFIGISLSPEMLLTFFSGNALLLTVLRVLLAATLSFGRVRGRSRRNVIIIGTGKIAKTVADRIFDNKNWGLHILGFLDYHRSSLWSYREIPLMGHPDGLADIIINNQVDYIVMAVEPGDLSITQHAFAVAEEMGVIVCLMSDIYFHPISQASSTNFMEFPAMVYSSVPDNRGQLTIKNCIDWIGGFVGLLLSLPFTLLAAIAIKLEDGGPIFFRQTRSGKNGKPFTMLKFRTMVPDAEKLKADLMDKNEMSGPVFKIRKDPRITTVGNFMRKTSIDELPQFINVLRGDMSLVGPRPPLPSEVARYDRWQRRKLSVKPGLTCLWQINGRNHVDFEHWMKLDLEYIDNWSLWLDTKILVKTVPAIFKGI